jgi:hypothetical protein
MNRDAPLRFGTLQIKCKQSFRQGIEGSMKLRKKRRARRKRNLAATVLKENGPAENNGNWPLPFVLRSVKNYFEKEIPK